MLSPVLATLHAHADSFQLRTELQQAMLLLQASNLEVILELSVSTKSILSATALPASLFKT